PLRRQSPQPPLTLFTSDQRLRTRIRRHQVAGLDVLPDLRLRQRHSIRELVQRVRQLRQNRGSHPNTAFVTSSNTPMRPYRDNERAQATASSRAVNNWFDSKLWIGSPSTDTAAT